MNGTWRGQGQIRRPSQNRRAQSRMSGRVQHREKNPDRAHRTTGETLRGKFPDSLLLAGERARPIQPLLRRLSLPEGQPSRAAPTLVESAAKEATLNCAGPHRGAVTMVTSARVKQSPESTLPPGASISSSLCPPCRSSNWCHLRTAQISWCRRSARELSSCTGPLRSRHSHARR